PEPPGALVELSEARCGGGRTTDLPDAGVVRTSNRRRVVGLPCGRGRTRRGTDREAAGVSDLTARGGATSVPHPVGELGRSAAEGKRMEYAEARHQLLLHGPGTSGADGEPLFHEDGFTVSLRPYTGLKEKNFHLVMEALLAVGERLHREPQVDRDVVWAVGVICSTGRDYGLRPDGMLRRNRLITAADVGRLELWIDTVERSALSFLGGWPPHWVVTEYAKYVMKVGWWDNIGSFLPLFARAVSDPELPAGAIEVTVDALGKIGGLAAAVLSALRAAEQRSYTWETPADRCTEEVRARIRRAIQAIENTPPAEPV
ncbi:MAG: hypothetical protein JWO38_549, partial [Gemmataceae bacterium]|nr:hypothetical protein [Gemmataceae bacterium]